MMKFTKMVGVTLLEVMLVLAVAAMIIVMSIRYYQTATTNQQVNGMLQMIQAVSAAADGLAQGTGSYSSGSANTSNIKELMPNQSMNAPWGGTVTVTPDSASEYSATFTKVPPAVCVQVKSRLSASNKFTVSSTCGGTAADFTYTYDATK